MNTALACMPSWELAREVLTDMSVLDALHWDRLTVHGHCGVWTRVCWRCISLGQRSWNETATFKFQACLSRFNSELLTSAPLHEGALLNVTFIRILPHLLNELHIDMMKWLDMFVRKQKTEGAEACWRMPIWGSESGVWKISDPPSYSTSDFGVFITVVYSCPFHFSPLWTGSVPKSQPAFESFLIFCIFKPWPQVCKWCHVSSKVWDTFLYDLSTQAISNGYCHCWSLFCCRPIGSYCTSGL